MTIIDRLINDNGTEQKGSTCAGCGHYFKVLPCKKTWCVPCYSEMQERCRRILENKGLDREKVKLWRTRHRT